MKLKKTGNIPEKLIYICQPEQKVRRQFDDLDEEDAEILTVTPTFISDATNKNTLESGRRWAIVRGYYDYTNRNYVEYNPVPKPIEYEFDNTPIDNIKIINLEHRSQGGRAYKVIIKDKFYVDFREDILLELMLNSKVENGILYGQFIWARVNAEMKLIRVDSELHKTMIESTEMNKMKKINPKDYVVGGIYENKTKRMIYLGTFKSSSIRCSIDRYGYHIDSNVSLIVNEETVEQLWYNLQYGYTKKTDPKNFEEILNNIDENHFMLSTLKTSSMLKKTGQFEIPQDYVDQIRKIFFDKIEKEYNSTTNYRGEPWKFNEEGNKLVRIIDGFNLNKYYSICLSNEETHKHPRLKYIYDNNGLSFKIKYCSYY